MPDPPQRRLDHDRVRGRTLLGRRFQRPAGHDRHGGRSYSVCARVLGRHVMARDHLPQANPEGQRAVPERDRIPVQPFQAGVPRRRAGHPHTSLVDGGDPSHAGHHDPVVRGPDNFPHHHHNVIVVDAISFCDQQLCGIHCRLLFHHDGCRGRRVCDSRSRRRSRGRCGRGAGHHGVANDFCAHRARVLRAPLVEEGSVSIFFVAPQGSRRRDVQIAEDAVAGSPQD
mmetsp:Transcript_1456/g.4250  ORF Transcript_1456/g.4250 Transcript_1456/m.4250 type:complete len:227 (-) Transcript_1456:1086-1766(-)